MKLPEFLTEVEPGEVRLTGHRIGLYHVIADHKKGYSAARLHEELPTLSLDLIEKVLAFYRENRAEVDEYVARYEEEADRLCAATPRSVSYDKLLQRYEEKIRVETADQSKAVALTESAQMILPDFLTEWPYGEIVLTGHRIGLYHLISDYQDGCSPEHLHEEYPTLSLELINKVLAFYEANRAEVDAYLNRCREEIDRHMAATPRKVSYDELLRRYEAKKQVENI